MNRFVTPMLKTFGETQPWIYQPSSASNVKILDALEKVSERFYEELLSGREEVEVPLLEVQGEGEWTCGGARLTIDVQQKTLAIDQEVIDQGAMDQEVIGFSDLRHVAERSCRFHNTDLQFVDLLYLQEGRPKHLFIEMADGMLCLRLINTFRKIIFTNAMSFELILSCLAPKFVEVTVEVDDKTADLAPVTGTETNILPSSSSSSQVPRTSPVDQKDADAAPVLQREAASSTANSEESGLEKEREDTVTLPEGQKMEMEGEEKATSEECAEVRTEATAQAEKMQDEERSTDDKELELKTEPAAQGEEVQDKEKATGEETTEQKGEPAEKAEGDIEKTKMATIEDQPAESAVAVEMKAGTVGEAMETDVSDRKKVEADKGMETATGRGQKEADVDVEVMEVSATDHDDRASGESDGEAAKTDEADAKKGKGKQTLRLVEMAPGYLCFYSSHLQRRPSHVAFLHVEQGPDVVEFVKFNSIKHFIYIDTPSCGFTIKAEASDLAEVKTFLMNNGPMSTDIFSNLERMAMHFNSKRMKWTDEINVTQTTVAQRSQPYSNPQGQGDSWSSTQFQSRQDHGHGFSLPPGWANVSSETREEWLGPLNKSKMEENVAVMKSKIEFLQKYHVDLNQAAHTNNIVLLDFVASNWVPLERELKDKIASGLVPKSDSRSLALDPDDVGHFTMAMEDVQNALFSEEPITALSSLRAYCKIFKESTMKDMRAIFEVLDEVTLLKGLYVLSLSQGAT